MIAAVAQPAQRHGRQLSYHSLMAAQKLPLAWPLLAPLFLVSLMAQPPSVPRDSFPPDIFQNSFRDVVKVAPDHYRVDLENENVRVLRAKLPQDFLIPQHDSRSALLVAVTECHLRFVRPDKKVQDVHLEPGQVRWIWADTFSARNLSTHPAEFLLVEPKKSRS